ncbi:Mis12 protein-domain-containing protein [Microdochium trichocladiopsis]|uniref:Mis12 protein-domain-containing protein n=1 Tax=Microdochium trichocladiopsis TaxID=1682393 RepID=A0A9P9BY41_9PEZI|nr:Mis12 protein-domain-containing protein [Microdochium trichocladiopsis]KAH7037678.1 Mis12 protein-domain-containing protein [Microdochium trichocladiopsis]
MADTELLTEHFGYPPVSLLDDIINSVNILAERALNSVEQGLLNAPPASLGFKTRPPPKHNAADPWNPVEAAKNEIEAGTHQLETLLCASIDRNLDKFELFVLRNFLCVQPVDIRDWMRLSHYEGLDFVNAAVAADSDAARQKQPQNASSDVPTLASINELRRKLRESMRLNALLTAERERNARTLQKLQHLILGGKVQVKTEGGDDNSNDTSTTVPQSDMDGAEKHGPSPFAFLQQKGTLSAAGGSTPLGTTTAFTLSQLQALRALSESLRNVTPDLLAPTPPEEDHEDEGDDASQRKPGLDFDEEKHRSKSWRRQRTEYVEHATRRHLEIVHGLELGRHGEVRDGEWQGEGRQLAHGEVEGLEKVAAILGRETASSSSSSSSSARAAAGGATQQDEDQHDTAAAFSALTTRRAGSAGPPAATPAAKSRISKSTATTPATAARASAASHRKPPASASASLRRTPASGRKATTTTTPGPRKVATKPGDGGDHRDDRMMVEERDEDDDDEEDLMDMS